MNFYRKLWKILKYSPFNLDRLFAVFDHADGHPQQSASLVSLPGAAEAPPAVGLGNALILCIGIGIGPYSSSNDSFLYIR